MFPSAPTLDAETAAAHLGKLLSPQVDENSFRIVIRQLHDDFGRYASTSPTPFIAPGVIVTPENRRQSELYLPVAKIADAFNRLYRLALTYQPVLSSTPFHRALSWADVFVTLPPRFQFTANPAELLRVLLSDQTLLTVFLFISFLPRRFYGGFRRYPEQTSFLREWFEKRKGDGGGLRCLDAACGTGEDTYTLTALCMETGFSAEKISIEGWTVEPLEVWSAAYRRFPHDKRREAAFRDATSQLFERGFQQCLRFRCADLTETDSITPLSNSETAGNAEFDVILCNGLLGGPILNQPEQLELVVSNLASLMAPGGILLAANSFHGGWKLKWRNSDIKTLLHKLGLKCFDAGGGLAGIKR